MKRLLMVIPLLAIVSTCRAALPINTEVLKKAVVFIYPARPDGTVDGDHPLRTGFLVGVPKQNSSSAYLFPGYRATHTRPDWAFCPPSPQKVFLRFNKTNYDPEKDQTGVEYVPLELVINGRPVYKVSDDDRVDAAIVQLNLPALPQSKYDYLPIIMADFATPEEIKALTIGDSIASAGLLPGSSGIKRNYPFFKFGNISNIPDEPVWSGCAGMPALRFERVWFVAANLVAGNSGSPIFYVPNGSPGVILGGAIMRPVLVGVQSMSLGGADIAGMTPVADLFKIIEQKTGLQTLDLYRGSLPKPK